jgi:formylmethanofuran dehydrogenase subunit E
MSFQLNYTSGESIYNTNDISKMIEIGEEIVRLHRRAIVLLKEGDEKRYEYVLTLIADYEKQLEEVETSLVRHESEWKVEKLKSERYQTRRVLSLLKEEQDRVWNSVERCWQCERTETLDGWVTYEGKEGQPQERVD